MTDYMDLISEFYPGYNVSCPMSSGMYSNLIWVDPVIPKATLDGLELDSNKNTKADSIDIKTQELIEVGFTFDSSMFSLSLAAQTNWMKIKTLKSSMTFPLHISTKCRMIYSLLETDVDIFVELSSDTVYSHMESGRLLRLDVENATTQTELDLVVDNR